LAGGALRARLAQTGQKRYFSGSDCYDGNVLAVRPLISKNDILRAYRPTAGPSEAVFRRLQGEGIVTNGIQIRPRRGGRLSGTITAFYALNEDAVVAYRQGDTKLAIRARKLAERAEKAAAARQVVRLASAEPTESAASATDLQAVYDVIARRDREPFDELAKRATRDRESISKHMQRHGTFVVLASLLEVGEDSASLASDAGLTFAMPRTPELVQMIGRGERQPVSVRMEHLDTGAVLTIIEQGWRIGEPADRDEDAFADLRPTLPADLDRRLDETPLRPVALTGPALRWA
jgi:hypothetical protein